MPDTQRILIVDDDPIVAESLSDFLKIEGFDCVTACDGREAMAVLDDGSSEVGIVITDVHMPRCDGLELLKHVRRNCHSVVVIMITGYGKIESAVEAVRATK